MNIMTKRGSEDNIVTYEHYCDTKADLANIPQNQIALGSVAIVLKDEDDSMGIYLANSNKEWISFSTSGGGSSMSDISLANLIDVSLANPNDGDTLVYDATSEKWVAQAGGESSASGLSKFPIIDCYMEGTLISGVCDTDYADIVNEIENGRAVYSIINIRLGDNVYTTVGISIIVANDEIVVSCLPDFNDSSANNYITFIRPSLSILSDNSCFGVMARSELLKRVEAN